MQTSNPLLQRLPGNILDRIRAERARRSSEAIAQQATAIEGDTIEASRQRCQSLAGFIREAWHLVVPNQVYIHNWHIDLICAHLEGISRGAFLAKGLDNRLLLNIPPGTMKSLLVCVFWPMWEWGPAGRPGLQYIAASYRAEYCVRDSNRCRKIIESDWYQARWSVPLTRCSDYSLSNAMGGKRDAVPFGSLTGGRADRLLIDDPHSVDTAESDADRERTAMRFRESLTTRLNDPVSSAIVVVMQRLHQKDVSGIIQALRLPYVHVMLPMRFDPARKCVTPFGSDPRTQAGELLFRERFPPEVLARDEAAMGSHAVAGQFDQLPTPRGGLLFKRHHFRIVQAAPADCRWVAGWDLAASEGKSSAYSCRVLLGYHRRDRHYYIRHVARERVTNPEQFIVRTAEQDTVLVGRHEISLPQDPGAAGKVQARSLVGALAGHNVYASPESGDKYSRAQPISAQAEAGNVSIVEGPWNEPFLDEIEVFPVGTYKDQVDALSRAFGRMIMTQGVSGALPILASTPKTYYGEFVG